MAREIAEAPPTGVGRLLEHNRFVVPNHQRDYSWTEDQVRQYLDDIEDANERADEQYFIGLMVFMRANGDGYVVLDGQQRLATTVLIMAAIRTWLKGYSAFEHEAGKIQHAFIGREDIGEQHSQPRLVLNAANHKAFEDFVVAEVPDRDIQDALSRMRKFDRSRRLLEAALYCRERVAAIALQKRDADATAKYLVEIVKYIRNSVTIVRLVVASEGQASTIFETLNDRGLELSALDLVKNYLFGRAETRSKTAVRDMEAR